MIRGFSRSARKKNSRIIRLQISRYRRYASLKNPSTTAVKRFERMYIRLIVVNSTHHHLM